MQSQFVNKKHMIVHGQGASNITYNTTTLPLVALVSQTSFGGETSGSGAKCRLCSQASLLAAYTRLTIFPVS